MHTASNLTVMKRHMYNYALRINVCVSAHAYTHTFIVCVRACVYYGMRMFTLYNGCAATIKHAMKNVRRTRLLASVEHESAKSLHKI